VEEFKPSTVNGKPMESVYETIQGHDVPIWRTDMQRACVSAYEALQAAVSAKDRAAADAAMKRLKVTTLSEDSLYWLAQFQCAPVWEDDPHQEARRSIAGTHRRFAGADQRAQGPAGRHPCIAA
jgi:hypothetical protein